MRTESVICLKTSEPYLLRLSLKCLCELIFGVLELYSNLHYVFSRLAAIVGVRWCSAATLTSLTDKTTAKDSVSKQNVKAPV